MILERSFGIIQTIFHFSIRKIFNSECFCHYWFLYSQVCMFLLHFNLKIFYWQSLLGINGSFSIYLSIFINLLILFSNTFIKKKRICNLSITLLISVSKSELISIKIFFLDKCFYISFFAKQAVHLLQHLMQM